MRVLLFSDGIGLTPADGATAPRVEIDVLRADPDVCAMPLGTPGRVLARRLVDPAQVLRLARRMRGAPACLALGEEGGYPLALASALRPSRPRVFIPFHGQHWWSRRNRLLAGIAARLGNVHFLPLSAAVGRILTDAYGVDRARVHVAGYGVDARFFAPAPPAAAPVVASAGTAARDYRTLAAAVAGLDVHVEVAADSAWRREPPDLAGAALPPNLRMFSAGDHRGLREVYARARFVVVPLFDVRHAAGYAVIAEAMAMGKAVIATRTQGSGDLIEHGANGLYVPPGDAAALRDAIAALLADRARAARMGHAARQAVERRLTVEAYAARIRGVIERVAAAGRARAGAAAATAVEGA